MMDECKTRVEIFIRAENLKDMDTMSKSDPYAVLRDAKSNVELGRTEVQKDNLNPTFSKTMMVDYYFERKQEFTVEVYDYDDTPGALGDTLGRATFSMGQLMGSKGSTISLKMEGKGMLQLTGAECSQANCDVDLMFEGNNLKNMDTFSKSDPFFLLSRILPNGQLQQLYKSETIDDNLNPRWKPLPRLSLNTLCGGNMENPVIHFKCFDEDMTSNDPMGEFRCSFNQILEANKQQTPFSLLDPKSKELFGRIRATKVNVIKYPTFVDFLKAGLQVNIAVSVDFTASNGDPKQPRSLHYMSSGQPNQYVQAIMAVGDVLRHYDADKQFPAFGFGAKIPPNMQFSNYFHLNLQQNPYVNDVQGILNAYGTSLPVVKLYGPTNFAPTIEAVTQAARSSPKVYTVLLIITDGEITDMSKTIDVIVKADDAPLSIIIVGVGSADFGSMDQLDADEQALQSYGRISRRDIVQFVPFMKYQHAGPEMLAADVLKEVPAQVLSWAKLANLTPETLR